MKVFHVLIFVFCFLFYEQAYGLDSSDKIYIQPLNVTLRGNEIWIQLDTEWVRVRSLSSDANGVFLAKDDLPLGFWICKNGHTNYPWTFVCSCGAGRGG